jgi:L-lactate dehydrogenase
MKNFQFKVAIVGMGAVGATFAYAMTMKGLAHKLALINRHVEKAEGEAMDLIQGLAFAQPVEIDAGGYELAKDAQIVVLTAGAAQAEDETRLDLAGKNAKITKEIVHEIMEHNPNPIFLVVANPVDILTYVTLKESGLPPERVIGSGTALDTVRFRHLIGEHCNVDPRNVHGYIIGEHGDSEVPIWSRTNIAGVLFENYCNSCDVEASCQVQDEIAHKVRNAAYEIIKRKGATYYAIGLCMVRIVEAILKDQKSVLTVSSLVQGQYGVRDVCMSLPRVVGGLGVEHVVEAELTDDERQALEKSAGVIRETLDSIGY